MAAMVRLEWWRYPDGFDIVERPEGYGGIWRDPKLIGKHSAALVIARGSDAFEKLRKGPRLWLEARRPTAFETYLIEGTENRVFRHLANMPPTPEGAQAFANRWGLLNCWGWKEFWALIDVVHAQAKTMNMGIDYARRDPKEHTPESDRFFGTSLELLRGKLAGDVRPSIFLKANTLFDFCWAEFMQLEGSGVQIRRCPRCGSVLVLGTVGQPAIYCSNACRIAMHRRSKKESAERAARRRRARN